jgi:hypothetical protein
MAVKRLGNVAFIFLWVLANLLPWLAICGLWVGLSKLFNPNWPNLAVDNLFFLLLGWCAICVAVGLAQWQVLRSRLTGMGWWPVATVVGSGGPLLLFPLGVALPGLPSIFLIPIFLGGGIGVAQWLVLRRRLPGSGIWIVIQMVAAIAAMPVGLFAPGVDVVGGFILWVILVGGLVEVVAGLITGLGLLVLMQRAGR